MPPEYLVCQAICLSSLEEVPSPLAADLVNTGHTVNVAGNDPTGRNIGPAFTNTPVASKFLSGKQSSIKGLTVAQGLSFRLL
jgi:hypothetical protein